MESEIEKLKKENELLKQQLQETHSHLQKYTYNSSHKKYKEKNKEKILQYAREYSKKMYEKKKSNS
jgi:acetyl-CoA carboxylase alpha subunit